MRPSALLSILLVAACAGPERRDEVGPVDQPGDGAACPAVDACCGEGIVCPAGEECFVPELCADETVILKSDE